MGIVRLRVGHGSCVRASPEVRAQVRAGGSRGTSDVRAIARRRDGRRDADRDATREMQMALRRSCARTPVSTAHRQIRNSGAPIHDATKVVSAKEEHA